MNILKQFDLPFMFDQKGRIVSGITVIQVTGLGIQDPQKQG